MGELATKSLYVLCIDDGGYPESLEVNEVYVALEDEQAAQREYLRVIDETGEDYLYPAKFFLPVEGPSQESRVLPARVSNPRTR
jgi:hypothetical protein